MMLRLMPYRSLVIGVSALVFAISPDACISQARSADEDHHHQDQNAHETHLNHIAIFGGVTANLEKKDTPPTIGVDFTRRLTVGKPILGVGLFGEAILGTHTEWLLGVLFYYKPFQALWFRGRVLSS